ncbi:MAG: lactate racemase domain-containing protein [Desulfovibrionaceae bacterium]
MLAGKGSPGTSLTRDEVYAIIEQGAPASAVAGKRILVLTPDATRTAPLPMMVRAILDIIAPHAAHIDFMAALGTHQPLADAELLALYGLDAGEKARRWPGVRLRNHRWDIEGTLTTIGRFEPDEVAAISGGLFHEGVDVAINKAVLDYDLIIILGPVFPHEVAGFSGGNKYLFPGIAGGELLHFTHWLGAVVTCWDTIGIRRTPVREAIDRAARLVPTPRLCMSMVVRSKTELAGLWVGETDAAWTAATELSARMHIVYKDRPFHTVLGTASPMYSEIWVAGKVMYKLEPVVADGGTLIIHGRHINRVSDTWGRDIARIGYHTRDYFLNRMGDFRGVPLGVLAHSTHVRGLGRMDNGVEKPRISVVLATSIPEEECRRINLGYMDPDAIDIEAYRNREHEGVLLVENAGEILHRLAPGA